MEANPTSTDGHDGVVPVAARASTVDVPSSSLVPATRDERSLKRFSSDASDQEPHEQKRMRMYKEALVLLRDNIVTAAQNED